MFFCIALVKTLLRQQKQQFTEKNFHKKILGMKYTKVNFCQIKFKAAYLRGLSCRGTWINNDMNPLNFYDSICLSESSQWRSFIIKAILKEFAILTGKHLCWSFFFIKLQVCNFIRFFFELYEIYRNTYFVEHPPMAVLSILWGMIYLKIISFSSYFSVTTEEPASNFLVSWPNISFPIHQTFYVFLEGVDIYLLILISLPREWSGFIRFPKKLCLSKLFFLIC